VSVDAVLEEMLHYWTECFRVLGLFWSRGHSLL